MVLELSSSDARGLAIRAQGLSGRRHRNPLRLLRALGAVQIDTISVVARSHELVAFARLLPVSREDITTAFWGRGQTFEYWAHAACVLPLELWPLFAWRRRHYQRRFAERTPEQAEVLNRVRDRGALTIGELGGARLTRGWWEWSPFKAAAEQLLARGEVICTERRGFRRVYRLTEEAVPPALLADEPDDATCHAALVRLAAARMGVATMDELADYFRQPVASVRGAVEPG
jgi:uncharacterized protein